MRSEHLVEIRGTLSVRTCVPALPRRQGVDEGMALENEPIAESEVCVYGARVLADDGQDISPAFKSSFVTSDCGVSYPNPKQIEEEHNKLHTLAS
jgi:hypothetical protein